MSWDGGLDDFTKGYKFYGPQYNVDGSVTWREWAPGAHSLHLQGDFSMFQSNIKFYVIYIFKYHEITLK